MLQILAHSFLTATRRAPEPRPYERRIGTAAPRTHVADGEAAKRR